MLLVIIFIVVVVKLILIKLFNELYELIVISIMYKYLFLNWIRRMIEIGNGWFKENWVDFYLLKIWEDYNDMRLM